MYPTVSANNNITKLPLDQVSEMQAKKTYANATVSDMFPSKEQGVIIEAHEGISIKEYVSKLATVMNPNDIRFVSRISNNRVCVFLSTKKAADYLTTKYPTLTINNHELNVRPLINKLKRVIISNVCPVIPHDVIHQELLNHNIHIKSNISFIRAGIPEPGFAHIMSFRRQAFITPEDVSKLPESTTILYDDTLYRIFFSTDDMTCFLCKQSGHLANQCNSKPIQQSVVECDLTNDQSGSNITNVSLEVNEPQNQYDNLAINDSNFPSIAKRNLPSDSSSQTGSANNKLDNSNMDNSKQIKKKKKVNQESDNVSSHVKNPPKPLDDLLAPLKVNYEANSNDSPITYNQLKNFIDKASGSQNPTIIANECSLDIQSIIQIMTKSYPLLIERSIKYRFTSIINKLKSAQEQKSALEQKNTQEQMDDLSSDTSE